MAPIASINTRFFNFICFNGRVIAQSIAQLTNPVQEFVTTNEEVFIKIVLLMYGRLKKEATRKVIVFVKKVKLIVLINNSSTINIPKNFVRKMTIDFLSFNVFLKLNILNLFFFVIKLMFLCEFFLILFFDCTNSPRDTL